MNVYLRDDHDEALTVWRRQGVKNLDLVHVDAHLDFALHPARRPQEILEHAASLKQLKENLEYTLCFLRYEKTVDTQTNIGNYIYPAMRDGLVKNFWWVIPGSAKNMAQNFKTVKSIFKNAFGSQPVRLAKKGNGLIESHALGREFRICTLDSLPVFSQHVLLDIDVDFLVVPDLKKADNRCDIGRRKLWIEPERLKDRLQEKIKTPRIVTIVYSTRGGYTPMEFRYLGDELAYCFDPVRYEKQYKRAIAARDGFAQFRRTGKKPYYREAVKLDPHYRNEDNNLGPLYIYSGRLAAARKELEKILKVDPGNANALKNMGIIQLRRKKYLRALNYFNKSLTSLTGKERWPAILSLAETNFRLKRYGQAEDLYLRYIKREPRNHIAAYCLGMICQEKKDFTNAGKYYRRALQLGFKSTAILRRLLAVSFKLDSNKKEDIITSIRGRLSAWSKEEKKGSKLFLELNKFKAQMKRSKHAG